MIFQIKNLVGLIEVAKFLVKTVLPGEIVGLHGDLGAGKTTLIKYFAELNGISKDQVTSPTYNLCNYYYGEKLAISHWDLYRTKGEIDSQEVLEYKYFPGWITFVEWPIIGDILIVPLDHLISISFEEFNILAIDLGPSITEDKLDTLLGEVISERTIKYESCN